MRASEDGELLPAVVVDVPDVLYLQVVDTDDCEDWPAPSEPDERTHCADRINASDVAYVPLALAERAEAEAAHYRAQLSAAEEAALECQREAAALRAQLDAMHRKASNLELELEQSERQRREISDMADKMADKWTLQVEQLRAERDAARAGQE